MMLKNNYLIFVVRFVACYFIACLAMANSPSQEQVNNKIEQLSTGLRSDKQKTTQLKNEVEILEKKLGEITRKKYATEKKIKKIEKKLKRFAIKRKRLGLVLSGQKKALAQQLQAYYSAGEQSHLRLLLRQDNPSSIGRTIKYFGYLNQSRLDKIRKVKKILHEIDVIEKEGLNDKKKLQSLIVKLTTQKKASKRVLLKREAVYKKTKKSLRNKDKQLKRLKAKEAGLQAKIDGLVKSEKKESKREEKKISASSEKKNKRTNKVGVRGYRANKSFAALRGKLSWPVKGKRLHNYGAPRNKKQRWKGVIISARGGAKVKSIAAGEVEFAGWFNGYGYLVIIRHDKRYRSLYGYNRAVHVNVGQTVKAGTTIASVGNSGGQQRNALYFEIRKQTQPKNPAKWCR